VSVECLSPKKNTVFTVGYAGRETVLKIVTAPPDSVRAESAVVQFVAGRTSIPAPAVLAAGKVPLPAPFALFERVAGRTVDNLSPVSTTLRGVSPTVGRHLTTLHAAETFDDAGPLVAGLDGLQPADVTSEWPSVFEQTLRAKVDDLPLAFDAHADTGDTAVAWVTTNPGWCGDCVPTHLDHRPANPVLRPMDGVDGRAAGGASEDSGTGDGANRVVAVLD
jgi:aminoglycoside phosphotransferase (APT) family kinase protein